MLRVVLNANVYVSAIIRPEGPPGQIVERFLRGMAFEIVISLAIAEEILKALTYPKVRKYIRADVVPQLWLEDILVLSHMVADDLEIPSVSANADDDKYVAAAIEGRATLIVTGDPDLLTLKEHQGVRIVTPRVFLDLLDA